MDWTLRWQRDCGVEKVLRITADYLMTYCGTNGLAVRVAQGPQAARWLRGTVAAEPRILPRLACRRVNRRNRATTSLIGTSKCQDPLNQIWTQTPTSPRQSPPCSEADRIDRGSIVVDGPGFGPMGCSGGLGIG
ncbi:hypothetical protein VTN31DRAFT_5710 [Thermomyces dupontii]|uniref:uncharacterized protein n=1 Tax=Talaromyces thermophilus TaxID=28565 RepID=UPI00374312FA